MHCMLCRGGRSIPGVCNVAIVDSQSGLVAGYLLLQTRRQLQGGALLALLSAC